MLIIANTSGKIKELIRKCGINQKELARRMNISEPALSKKMKTNNWKESDLKKIAQVCHAEYDVIFKFCDQII